jgi:hypothetical protein
MATAKISIEEQHNLHMSKLVNIGALMTDMANILDSLNDCNAPNALHAKVAICEKIIDLMNNVEI